MSPFLFFQNKGAAEQIKYLRLLLSSQGFPFRGLWEKNRASSPPASAPKPCKYTLWFAVSPFPPLVLTLQRGIFFLRTSQSFTKSYLTLSARRIWTLTYFLWANWSACVVTAPNGKSLYSTLSVHVRMFAEPCCWWTPVRCRLNFSQWPSSLLAFSTRKKTPTSPWSNTPSSPH